MGTKASEETKKCCMHIRKLAKITYTSPHCSWAVAFCGQCDPVLSQNHEEHVTGCIRHASKATVPIMYT